MKPRVLIVLCDREGKPIRILRDIPAESARADIHGGEQ